MRAYRTSGRAAGSRFSLLPILLAAVAAGLVLAFGYVLYRMLTASAPQIVLGAPFEVVGRNAPLLLEVKDERHGLRAVRVAIRQNDKEAVLLEETYPEPRPRVQFRWVPSQAKDFKLAEGPGRLEVRARNASWGSFFRGRSASLARDFKARLVPPRVEVLTTQHYVNQGGCDAIVYRVTPPDAESGVVVGEAHFPGFPVPGATDPKLRFAVFAYPYDAPAGTRPRLRARDEAGNEVTANFHMKLFPKVFRERTLPVDDAFLDKVVPEIVSNTPGFPEKGSRLETYLAINRDLRKANNQALAELAGKSEPRFLWSKPFQQLGSSQVEASFADHRTYVYQGKEVDRQDHLGYDLATTSHAPIAAANDGKVVLADYLGIYGNTVVIDHGFGLLSVYGHLSSIDVKPGDMVTRGQAIGRSGETGLAGGDHLHYSMVLHATQVDPKEWWDPHWIEDRLMSKLRQYGQAPGASGSPAPSASPAPSPAARR